MEGIPPVGSRLGHLLKHAQARMAALNERALAPLGTDARELGVLLVLAAHEPGSQRDAADRLGVDRTTMVALLDGLEAKGVVARRPHGADRRRNLVELTDAGRDLVLRAVRASDDAERALLAPLDDAASGALRRALERLATDGPAG